MPTSHKLITPRAQTNGKGSTPLHLAVENGHMSVAEMLLERGGDPRKENEDVSGDGDGERP